MQRPQMGNNLKKLRIEFELTQDRLAQMMGTTRSQYVKLESGERKLSEQWARRAAHALGVDPGRVITDEELGPSIVPVMGYVGAGAEIMPEFEQVPPEGLDTIELPFSIPPDIIAFRVRGESMLPVYREGDTILVYKDQRLASDNYVGEEAAIRTEDGRRFLKEIQRGSRRGVFNLYSHNARLIEDVHVAWIGEIFLVVKAPQIRRAVQAQNSAAGRRQAARARNTAGMDELPLEAPNEQAERGRR